MLLNTILERATTQAANVDGSRSIAFVQTLRGGDITSSASNLIQHMIPNKIHIGLFLFHWLLGTIFIPRGIYSKLSPRQRKHQQLILYLCEMIATAMWMGFVFAISGMEAWLKFRAPFCPREYALDIGRTIFPALNAVEFALCLICWQNHLYIGRLLLVSEKRLFL